MLLALAALLVLAPQDQPKVFFGNLHSHTSFSDGSGSPEDAFKHARDTAEVDFLAITVLHYTTTTQRHQIHDIYRRLYYLPIILGGFWFSLRGGVGYGKEQSREHRDEGTSDQHLH